MIKIGKVTIVIAVLLLWGCAGRRPVAEPEIFLPVQPDYARYSLTELAGYLAYLSESSLPERQAECRRLQDGGNAAADLGRQLHQALAWLVTPQCREMDTEAMRQTVAVFGRALSRVRDPRLKRFLAYHQLLAQQFVSRIEQAQLLSRELKQLQRSERKLRQRLDACSRKSEELEAKLEALKALEDSLNHNGIP